MQLYWFVIMASIAAANAAKQDLGPLCTQKNQGNLGTCHAFSLTCPLEAMEAKVFKNPNYSVSENWLVFISVLDRLCTPANNIVKVDQGYGPDRNVDRLRRHGYCDAGKYSAYDPIDGARGQDKANEEKANEETVGLWKQIEEETVKEPPVAGTRALDDEARIRGIMKGPVALKFQKAFGIDWQDAKGALCKGSDQDMKNAIAALGAKVSPKFKACFQEALTKKQRFNEQCGPRYSYPGNRMGREEKIRQIKASLDRGEPVMISIEDYTEAAKPGPRPPPRPNDKHYYHAVSVVGYDDAKELFIVRNSWGPSRNSPVLFAKAEQILGFGTFNCQAAQRMRPRPTRRPYTRELGDPPKRESNRAGTSGDGEAAEDPEHGAED